MGDALGFLTTVGAAFAVLVAAAKIWSMLNRSSERREDRASYRQINEGLRAENARCREDLERAEAARLRARDEVHRQNNVIMKKDAQIDELVDQLSNALLEMGLLRQRLGEDDKRPRLMPPDKEA